MNTNLSSSLVTDADRIREQLTRAGLSQRGAARELGIDERTMRHYCAGQLPVPPVVTLALTHMADIRLNQQALRMIEDGKMSASDGMTSVDRLVEANAKLRAANKLLMRMFTENRPPEQKALLEWFCSHDPTPDQLRSFNGALSKANACPRCWLEPLVDEQTGRVRERAQPTVFVPASGRLLCPACRAQYEIRATEPLPVLDAFELFRSQDDSIYVAIHAEHDRRTINVRIAATAIDDLNRFADNTKPQDRALFVQLNLETFKEIVQGKLGRDETTEEDWHGRSALAVLVGADDIARHVQEGGTLSDAAFDPAMKARWV